MKRGSLIIGLATLALACLAALAPDRSFTLHMFAHMTTVAIAAPLIAIGISGTRHDISNVLSWITPLTASLIELIVVLFWHLPQVREIADSSTMVAAIEQASFFAAGLLLWLTCIGSMRRAGGLPGVGGLLFTSMHMTLIGVLLALAPRPLYGTQDVICLGTTLSAAADQQIGGVIMLLVGAASYLIGGLSLLYRVIAIPKAEERRC